MEGNQGCPRLGAFVVPPIHSGWQYCRHYASRHASPECSTTTVAAVRHSASDDTAQRCRSGVSSSRSSHARNHSRKRTGRRGRDGLDRDEGASSSFRRLGRRYRDYPGLFAAATTAAVATSTLGTSRHGLEDGDLASSATAQDNPRLPSPRRQRQEKLLASPRRGDGSPGPPAAVAGMFASRIELVHVTPSRIE